MAELDHLHFATTRYLRRCSLGRGRPCGEQDWQTRIATNAVEARVDVHFVRVHLEPAPDAGRLLRLRGDTIRHADVCIVPWRVSNRRFA